MRGLFAVVVSLNGASRISKLLFVTLIVIGTVMSMAAQAATITPVGPFSGDLLEDFESFPPTAANVFVTSPNSFPVFGGAATHTRLSGAEPQWWWTGNWGFGLGSDAIAADGNKGFGINHLAALGEFVFNTPIVSFGAFFGTFAPGDVMVVRFFDAGNTQLGADQTFPYPNIGGTGILDWHGWDLDTPASRVEWGSISGAGPALDSIRVNSVPEPTTLALMALGLLGMGCFRRKWA